MHAHLAAAAARCATGNFAQQWQCKWNAGWNAPPSAAASRAGFDFGHNIVPILVVLVFLWLAARFARSRKSAPSAAKR